MADIFVSYTSSDREWAHWIALELEKLGHVPHVHEWEIKGGDDIYEWMEKRHDASDRVLCVVSDEYFKAPYSTLERNAALWQAAAKRPGFVLLVAVKPCKFPTLSDHLRRCELFGLPEEAARRRFRHFIETPVKPEAVTFPGKVFAVSNIPIHVPEHFLGRDDALAEIDKALARGNGRVAITTLHGMGGVGKTVLAAAYAEHHRADYRATWWVRAETPDTMRGDLVSLGVRLGWVAADDREGPALEKVRERLRDEGEGLLLIYDNAIDAASVRTFLPTAGAACALITSKAHAWGSLATRVGIHVWPKEVGADYFLARTGRAGERSNAEALSEELGGLPLAHEQAASYCERLEVSFAEYRKRFEATPIRLLDADKDASADYHGGLTVAKTFALAMEEAAKLHPAAEPLIAYGALLAPEPIPLFLFSEARGKFGEPLASQLAGDGLDEAIAALRAFALVDRETITDDRDPSTTTETIRLHRLVRAVAAGRLTGDAVEAARGVLIQAMDAVYPPTVFNDPNAWPRARQLDALALVLVAGALPLPKGTEAAAGNILSFLASYRHGALADYLQARLLFEAALSTYDALGPAHPGRGTIICNLALLFEDQGDFAKADPLFRLALAIREEAFGPNHHETANSLNCVAGVLEREGDLVGARSLYERAHAICDNTLGPTHPYTATCLHNLADVVARLGDSFGARLINERVLAIRQAVLGPEHPDTAGSLNNLGLVMQSLGDPAACGAHLARALAIREKSLGPDHPATNLTRNNLARLRLDQGDPSEALAMSSSALSGLERRLGGDHEWTKFSAEVKAAALDALGRADEAAAVRARYGIKGAQP